MRSIAFLSILLLIATTADAQIDLERDVIGSAGSEKVLVGMDVSFTIGEPAVKAGSTTGFNVNAGYQQTQAELVGSVETTNSGSFLEIYPNPSLDKVWVDWKVAERAPESISINNLLGQELYQKSIYSANAGKHMIDMGDLPAGVYILSVKFTGAKQAQNYKLIKKK